MQLLACDRGWQENVCKARYGHQTAQWIPREAWQTAVWLSPPFPQKSENQHNTQYMPLSVAIARRHSI